MYALRKCTAIWIMYAETGCGKFTIFSSISGEPRRRLPDLRHDGHVLRAPRPHPAALLEDLCHGPEPSSQSAGAEGRYPLGQDENRRRRNEGQPSRQISYCRADQQEEPGAYDIKYKSNKGLSKIDVTDLGEGG